MTNHVIIKMVLDAWHSKIHDADILFDNLTDEQLYGEVTPGRNRGVYLLGHLIAVHDGMLPLLNFGERLYKDLDDIYIVNPDRAKAEITTVSELRKYWKNINSILIEKFSHVQPDEWFQKHNAVSSEDFIKEPHRNKLNVIINRTNHLTYHTGQLTFLKK